MENIEFKSWTSSGVKTSLLHFLSYEESTLLNIISRTYHSGLGYKIDEQYIEKEDILCNVQNQIIEEVDKTDDENCFEAFLNLDLAKSTSENYLLKHKTIILRLYTKKSGIVWNPKPNKVRTTWFRDIQVLDAKYWYDLPSYVFFSNRDKKELMLTGPLMSRPYIHVVDEFVKIRLSSEEKESQLTIDDVLFACRGLCADDTRSIQSFNVLSDNGSTLKLKVNIDNFSS